MIANDQELNVTLDRIARIQAQVTHLPNTESSPANYHAAVSGFLAEIDRVYDAHMIAGYRKPRQTEGQT